MSSPGVGGPSQQMMAPADVHNMNMAIDAAPRSDLVRQVMGAISRTAGQGKSDAEAREEVARAVGISPEKLSPTDVRWLYKAVVGGLLGVMAVALVLLAWAILDGDGETSPDLLLTVFTGILGALVGLFARAPGQ